MPELQTTRIEPSICPFCGIELSAATGRGVPEPGSLSICGECGELSVFGAELVPRLPTPAELERITADVELSRKVAFYRGYCKRRRDASARN